MNTRSLFSKSVFLGKGMLAVLIVAVYAIGLPYALTAGTLFVIFLAAIQTGHGSAIHQPREVGMWIYVCFYGAWSLLIFLFERRFRLLPKCLRKLGLAECLRPSEASKSHQ